MSLCGPIFHVTPVDLCIIFQCKLYIYIYIFNSVFAVIVTHVTVINCY